LAALIGGAQLLFFQEQTTRLTQHPFEHVNHDSEEYSTACTRLTQQWIFIIKNILSKIPIETLENLLEKQKKPAIMLFKDSFSHLIQRN
jgi:hypothetical protein